MGRECPRRRISATPSDVATTVFEVQSPTCQETMASGLRFALTGISR
jgi:hypothetical protein